MYWPHDQALVYYSALNLTAPGFRCWPPDWPPVQGNFSLALSGSGFWPQVHFKGSDQGENRGVWININTRYLVWRCGDGRSFVL
jgi:hypothetical protein